MTRVRLDLAIRRGLDVSGDAACDPATSVTAEAAPARRPRALLNVKGWVKRLARGLRPAVGRLMTYVLAPAILRLDQATEARRALSDRLEALHSVIAVAEARQERRLAVIEQTVAEAQVQASRSLAVIEQTVAEAQVQASRRFSEIETRLVDLPGLFGPRFDELEIKIRPLVDYDPGHVAVRLREGYVVAPRNDPRFVTMLVNATSEGLEPGTRRVLSALIQPGMTVADVGANIGLLTMVCAHATGPAGRVLAFEPEPAMQVALAETLRLNGLSWVSLRAEAAGRTAGSAAFHVSPVPGHSSLYPLPEEEIPHSQSIEVTTVRLDDVLASDVKLDVIKIDVEGAELDVVEGARRLIEANHDIAIVAEFGPSHLTRLGIDPEAWFEAFNALGFRPHAIAEPSGLTRPIGLDDVRAMASVNIAFVRPGGRAEERLPR